jgi:hypothetical protein
MRHAEIHLRKISLFVIATAVLILTAGIGDPVGALMAQERCAEAPVEVTAASLVERRIACSAATDALQLLGRCKILRENHFMFKS